MNRILVLSDIHSQDITLKEILQSVNKVGRTPDFCLIAGDITNFGTVQDLQYILNLITQKIPNTFYVIGNCDPIIETRDLESLAMNVESQPNEINSFSIIGFGTHRPQFDKKKLRKMNRAKKKVCILTHVPPFGTSADVVSLNRHAGSKDLKEIIERNDNIFLSVCGHIHDSPTITKLRGCTIVNPGSVTVGNFAIIEVQKDLKIEGKIFNLHEL